MNFKTCFCCNKEKSISDFYKNNQTKDGFSCYCKNYESKKQKIMREKHKEKRKQSAKIYYQKTKKEHKIRNIKNHLKIRYNITIEEYQALLIKQNFCCAICGEKETRKNSSGNGISALSVDHNHKTDKVRGLLCQTCNTGVGMFKDNVDLLYKAVDYLSKENLK